jgi:SAM-dependent methyltransferase
VCDAERLPFADQSFDRIWGNAILHHLDLDKAAREIDRVLAPGGVAVFCEPWGGNRWLNWARQHLPYPRKDRTTDETPLSPRGLAQLRIVFAGVDVRGFQLFSMLRRVVPHRRVQAGLGWCDDWLLRCWPAWQRYCRYLVIKLLK